MKTLIRIMGDTAVTISTAEAANVVTKVSYRICATNGTRNAYHSGVAVFEPPASGSFIPYEQFTVEQVTAWIASTIDDDVYTALEAELAKPAETDTTLPWKLVSDYLEES